jgi:hypothetical protein
LTVGDFLAVYHRVVVFDLIGVVSAAVRARGHLPLVELHAQMVCAEATFPSGSAISRCFVNP